MGEVLNVLGDEDPLEVGLYAETRDRPLRFGEGSEIMVLLDSLVEQEALRRLPLSEHVRSLLPAVVEFPLGNAAGLALVSGRDHSNVYPRLWELHGTGGGGV